ncbi:MAG: TonB-dependent receptor, partial [Calditrichia bacterium]|nr:TonB-dependent receptor [Calditrichia bacterium]
VHIVNTDTLDGIYAPQRNDEYGVILNADINHSFNDNFSFHVRGHYYDWLLKKIYVNKYWDYTSSLYSGDLELTYSPSEKSTNIFGLSYNNLQARRYKSDIDAYDIGKDNESTTDFSLYLNGNYKIIKKLNLFYGGRYYKSSYQDISLSNFSPRGAITFQVNPKWYLKVLYGNSFRVPTYFEKEVSSKKVKGNPNLEPEKSTSYDFVVSRIFGGVRLNVNLFYMETDDKITRVTYAADSTKKQNQNIGKVSFKGLEVETKFRFSEKAVGFMGFSFIKGLKGINEKDDEDLKFTYEKMLSFGMTYKPIEQLSIDPTLKYLDQWGEADSYILANLSIRYKPDRDSPFDIFIMGENLFNKEIYLPEIARDKEAIPVIPKTMGRLFNVGFSASF